MRKIVVFIIFATFVIIAKAQNAEQIVNQKQLIYADSLKYIGNLYLDKGDYAQAEKYLLKAKNIQEKILDKEHPDYANVLNSLGLLYLYWGYYVKAEKYLLEAKYIRGIVFGEAHPGYAASANNLGMFYYYTGDYAQAEKYYLEAKNIRKEVFTEKSPEYAASVNNLGVLNFEWGNYEQAEKYLLEAKSIREMVLGKEHPDYAGTLNNLGVLYLSLNDYVRAEKYLLEAKNIQEKVLGNEHPNYATLLNSLGVLYYDLDDYTQAEKYYLNAKNIQEKVFGKENPVYVASLNNLGLFYFYSGDYTQAEKYILEAKDIFEKVSGKENPSYATAVNNLGVLNFERGNYVQAEKYLLEAKSIRKKVLGEEHPDYNTSLNGMKFLYQDMKKYDQAIIFDNEACELSTKLVNKNFAFLSEQQRNQFWINQEFSFIGSYSLSWFYPVPLVNSLNYNNSIFIKGLLLRTTNNIRDAVYSSRNQSLINNFEQLSNLRNQISNLQQKANFNEDYVQILENRADSLDKVVTRASQAYQDLKTDMSMTWQDIQKQLNPNEAAIEFVSFRLYDKQLKDSTMYAALVLCPKIESPVWIPLCEQKELEGILKLTTNDPQLQTQNLYVDNGEKLYQLIWQPLEKELSNVKTVYYSPSGLLYKIAFNALPTDKNGTLLSDKYNLQLLSSTREIVRLKKESAMFPTQDTTIIYGGLNYSVPPSKMSTTEQRSDFPTWHDLPGTKAETGQIVSSLENKHIPYQYYTENQGTKESFTRLSGTKTGVIHLATHGFFLPDIENKVVEHLVQSLDDNKKTQFENPMLRSGLILSYANRQWLANNSISENGILTADEISHLNLTNVKLAVLSACETGLGDIKNSEGVFGLQRAFKLAGVESLIMSLWKVPDEATAELMTIFYQQWLSGQSKQNAFKIAQQKVREKYKFPYFWAGFVMID